MDKVQELFTSLLAEKGLDLKGVQYDQFETYFQELIAWNEKMNLTGITDREQVYVKHFYDSVSLSFYVRLQNIEAMADIGSGAGFPGIPLKIVYPDLQLTIIDSLNKRIQFLNYLVSRLGLKHVNCIHSRAEDAARKSEYRDQFELVTARAVARLNVLNEFCLPFVKVNGLFAAMKGTDPSEELTEAEFSMKELKAKLLDVHSFELPVENSARHIIVMKKMFPTPAKYPRKAGIPLKNPLVK